MKTENLTKKLHVMQNIDGLWEYLVIPLASKNIPLYSALDRMYQQLLPFRMGLEHDLKARLSESNSFNES